MMRCLVVTFAGQLLVALLAGPAAAQPLGEPDAGAPGDAMIQAYLRQETAKIAAQYPEDYKSPQAWKARQLRNYHEYFYMLGLFPMPERTPLHATVTGTYEGDGFVVEKLHFESRPKLYVTANLYRPTTIAEGERLPAVLYVCGHGNQGRNGNKTHYMAHGIWLAKHGYVCLMLDTLQLSEIAATHHGTYNLERWAWHSRGYTPAGVEAWNGIRAIDYLISRKDVDPDRIGVTGISGGGAATFWIAAADERVRVAVPLSGMADLESYVSNRTINGHCDCMFLYNTFRWPWTRIAGLIAPRPMLFGNSDLDPIFPMDANERVIARLERLYSLYGAGDRVDALVSIGGHAYRQDLRAGSFRFLNTYLKGDSRPVDDTEVDLVVQGSDGYQFPIPPEELRVFPKDEDLPRDQLNTRIDELFVAKASPPKPKAGDFESLQQQLLGELRRLSFGYFPETIPAASVIEEVDAASLRMRSEDQLEFRLHFQTPEAKRADGDVLLVVLNEDETGGTPKWVENLETEGRTVVVCEPRGVGATRWTRNNPPNYVERSHALLGRTVDAGRVWDIIAAAKFLATHNASEANPRRVSIAGQGNAGVLAAYAALWMPEIEAVTLVAPPATHDDHSAPQFLNVLRVCDLPTSLGLLAPRRLTVLDAPADFQQTSECYEAAGAGDRLSIEQPKP